MAAPLVPTSLKLPADLKRRIARQAAKEHKTPHALMVETLAREAERTDLRARFAADSADSEREAMTSGTAFELGAAFTFLEARLAGKAVRRPKARPWRASK
jgi:predicted transcriptional regulator